MADLKQFAASLAGQFHGLGERHPGQWPLAPRLLCAVGVLAGVVGLGYFAYWSGQFEQQEAGAAEELRLREQYRFKTSQAVNLPALRQQKVLVDQYVERLQKQLPSKAEMAALLTDINQAGVGRGLTFDLFKPGNTVVRDYYAELPIEIRVIGTYHDIGAFASDMANLPRIVTLNNMSVVAGKDGVLTLDAVAKTFRYLDEEEANAARQMRLEREKEARKGAKK